MVVPTPDGVSATRWCWRRRALAGVDRVFTIGGAQAVGALAYGTADRSGGRQDHRPRQRLRRERQAARVRHGRHRHDRRARARSSCWPTAPRRPTGSRWTCSARPSTTSWRRASCCAPTPATSARVRQAIERLLPQMPRRDVIRASLEGRGALIRTRDLEEACAITQPHRARAPRDQLGRAAALGAAAAPRRRDLPRRATRARASATTAPARTTCCRPPAPRASRRRSASTTSRSAPA